MKTRVQIFRETYYVNESKQVVTCKLRFRIDVPWISENRPYIESDTFGKILKSVNIKHQSSYEVIGVAYCSPEDSFDLETGKRIAKSRAENYIYRMAERYWMALIDYYDKLISEFYGYRNGCVWQANREEDRLLTLIGKIPKQE